MNRVTLVLSKDVNYGEYIYGLTEFSATRLEEELNEKNSIKVKVQNEEDGLTAIVPANFIAAIFFRPGE